MVVPITDVVKMTLSVADISVEPIIGTPLLPCHKFDSHVIAMTVFVQTDYNVGICVFLRNTHSYSWYVHCSYSLCR